MTLESSAFYGLLEPAVKIIEEKYLCPDFSVGEIAEACNISEQYLRKLFIKQVGISPKQCILDLRIEKAKEILSIGELNAGETAELCGFTNQFHFSRLFRKKVGMTPTQYKKQEKIKRLKP